MKYDFLNFLYRNSFTKMAVLVLIFILMYRFMGIKYSYDIVNFTLFITGLLFIIALIQELLFMMNKKVYVYKDLVSLLMITTKIEKTLENINGFGSGMFEKAQSIENKINEKTLNEILYIAEVRNNAIHGSPEIKNINHVIERAKIVLKEIQSIS